MLNNNPETRISWRLRDIHHRHMMFASAVFSSAGLHWGQPRILHVVSEMDGATQKEIAEKLGVSPASFAMSIKRMQRAELLEKVCDEKDLRVNLIRLTEKGRKLDSLCLQKMTETDKQMLDGFTQEEIEQLDRYLARIYQNLEHIEESVHDS